MVKVAIYPPNSLILADLIERKGHTPLVLQKQIRQKIKDPEIDSPPMNITEEDPIKGLKYAAQWLAQASVKSYDEIMDDFESNKRFNFNIIMIVY